MMLGRLHEDCNGRARTAAEVRPQISERQNVPCLWSRTFMWGAATADEAR